MKYLKATLLGSGALASLLLSSVLTSCQDEDFGYTAEQIAYQSNFEKAFGKVTDIPTWDLSSYNLKQLGLKGGPSNDFAAIGGAQTRAFEGNASRIVEEFKDGMWYQVQDKSTRWLNRKLAEKIDNREQGKPFVLINPYYDEELSGDDRDFLIIPIYQGASGMCWDLHLVDDQYDYTIWSKSKDFRYTVYHDQWEEFFYSDLSTVFDHGQNSGYKRSISLKEAFANYNSVEGAQVFFEVNAGTLKGRFAIQQQVYDPKQEEDRWEIAYLTNELTFNFSDTKEANSVSLTSYPVGNSYKSSDGNNYITVANNYSNLFFVLTEQSGGVVVDPYPAQRVHAYVKTNDTNNDVRYLYNFVADKDKSKTGNFIPQYDSREELSPLSNNVSYFEGHTINRRDVESKVMRINTRNLGREFSLYLETKYSDRNNTKYAEYGDKHRSNGNPNMMLALHEFNKPGIAESEKPIDIQGTLVSLGLIQPGGSVEGFEYMVIGCEDAARNSDNDINDVVLLFVGMPKVPKIATEVIQKRYLVEDLGSTFDFDFNDIVVDVTQENIVDPGTGSETAKQIVSVAHLCGTIPFDLHFQDKNATTTTAIFDHKFEGKNDLSGNNAGPGDPGYDPRTASDYITKYVKVYNETQNFKWRPDENNIVVYVWPNLAGLTDNMGDGNSSLYNDGSNNLLDIKAAQRIDFPQPGKFPYIIAVDQDINWMPELHQVPRAWFEISENQDQYDQGGTTIPGVEPHKPTDGSLNDESFKNALGGTLIPASDFHSADNGVTTLNLGAFVNDNSHKYRAGDITVKVGLSAECNYTNTTAMPEVKAILYKLDGSTKQPLTDGSISLNNFETNANNSQIIDQSFVITSDEILAAAKANNLYLDITYATYGFTIGWNPRARMTLSWPDLVPYGAVTKKNGSYDSNNTSSYGEKVTINDNNYTTNWGGQNIYFGNTYRTTGVNPITPEQNAYVTFVVPANTTVKGSFWGFDAAGSIYSTNVPDLANNTRNPQIFTIQLSDVLKEQIFDNTGKSQLRFHATQPNTLDGIKNIQVYVNWDNNLPSKTLTIVNADTQFDPLSLTVKINNNTVSYNAGGIQVSPNATVSVAGYWDTSKQNYPNYTGQNDYRIMWTSANVGDISDTKHNEAFEFKMPNDDVTITADLLYKLVPEMQKYILEGVATSSTLDNNDSYAKNNSNIVAYPLDGTVGDITLVAEDGRRTINEPIFVKYNSQVKATIAVNDGYIFEGWRWSNGNTSTTYTVTMNNRGTKYGPHAAIFEGYRVTVEAIPAEGGTVKIGNGTAGSKVYGDYVANTNLTLTASQPNSGYVFGKWSGAQLTYSRALTVTSNHYPTAIYIKGTKLYECTDPANPTITGNLDRIKNDGTYNSVFTTLKNALNNRNSATLHIYCTVEGGTGKVQLSRYTDQWSGGWQKVANTSTATISQNEATISLDQTAINDIQNTNSLGVVIQNVSGDDNVNIKYVRVVIE